MRVRKQALTGAVVFALVAALAGTVASAARTHRGRKSPIVLGAEGTFSGPIGPPGVSYLDGFRAALLAANKAGGIDGHKMVLDTMDNGGTAATAVTDFRTLVTVDHIIGTCCAVDSATTVAVDPLWQKYKIPGISEGVPSATLTDPRKSGNHFAFLSDLNTGIGSWPQLAAGIGLLAHKKGIGNPKVALAVVATATSVPWNQGWTAFARQKGWTVTTSQQVSPTGTDAGTAAAAIAQSNPDFVAVAIGGPPEVPFLQALRQSGYTGPIVVWSAGVSQPVFSQINDPKLYGLDAYSYPSVSNAATRLFVKRAKAANVDPNGQLTPSGYVAGLMYVAALQNCGPACTGPKLSANLQKLSGFTAGGLLSGPLQISRANHDAFRTASLVTWANNAWHAHGSVTASAN